MKFNNIRVEDDTVYVTLVGPQSQVVASETLARFKRAVAQAKRAHDKVYVYVDLGGVTLEDVNSDARLAMKEAFGLPFERLAAVGHNRMMEVAMYLMKAGGAADRAQYFTSKSAAQRWLRRGKAKANGRLSLSVLVAGLFIAAIGCTTLLGWYLHNRLLMSWLPYADPISPLDSVGLIVLGGVVAAVWSGKRLPMIAGIVVLFLLGIIGSFPNAVATFIFGERLWAEGAATQSFDAATLCYISAAASIVLVYIKHRLAGIAIRTLVVVIGLLAVLSIFNQLYDRDYVFDLAGYSSIPLSLATGFMILGLILALAAGSKRLEGLRQNISTLGWLVVAAIIFMQIVTCASWRQSIDRNADDTEKNLQSLQTNVDQLLSDRARAYTDALHGYRGLFQASDFVGQDEFQIYYQTVQLGKNYPGLRSLIYVARVPDDVLKKFPTSERNSPAATRQSAPLVVRNLSNLPVHYVLTYLAGTTNSTAIGNDLSADASRRGAFEKAEGTGEIVSSGTINLAASASAPSGKGFFLAVPVVDRGRAAAGAASTNAADKYAGFVGAVFNYDVLFKAIFANGNLLDGIDFAIRDSVGGNVVYSQRNLQESDGIEKRFSVPFADQTWDVTFKAPHLYGVSQNQELSPAGVLLTGQLLSLFLIFLFVILWRSRRSAMALADTITADLQKERNRAVGLQHKDDAILSSIGDAVFVVDTAGKLTLFNPAAELISGFSADEVMNKPYHEVLKFFYARDDEPNKDFVAEAQAGKLSSMRNHTYLIHKDGHRVPVADSAAPIMDDGGKQIGSIIVFRDVSREEELDRAKTEFVSLASHQLRTPLSAINWYGEMLLDEDSGKLSPEQREYAQEIFDGNQRMIELVNALLDVSRLDVGKIKSEPTPTDLPQLADSVLKELTASIKAKKQKVIDEIDRSLPVASTDPKLVRMIVQNLLSNAVKYTPAKGSVTIAVRRAVPAEVKHAKLKPGNYVMIMVADTGYGIPKAQQQEIFSKMFRADNVRKLAVEGTGLGLYIVKEVASKLGGAVWFESVEGKGTTFYAMVSLVPAAASEHGKMKEISKSDGSKI